MGEKARTKEILEKALVINKETGNRSAEALTLVFTGRLNASEKNFTSALSAYQQALEIFRKSGVRGTEIIILRAIGQAYDNLGQSDDKTLSYFEQMLATYKEWGKNPDAVIDARRGEKTALINIGNVYLSRGLYPKALELYNQALAIAKKINFYISSTKLSIIFT